MKWSDSKNKIYLESYDAVVVAVLCSFCIYLALLPPVGGAYNFETCVKFYSYKGELWSSFTSYEHNKLEK
jgi:hypothetical protein